MTAFAFSLKSAFRNAGRTATLVVFCSLTAAFVTLLGAFTDSVRRRIQGVLVSGITGHVQIRSADTEETDMAAHNDFGWYALRVMESRRVGAVRQAAALAVPAARVRATVRVFGFASGPRKEEQVVVVGVDPEGGQEADYRQAFLLSEGTYLDEAPPTSLPPILITSEQATLIGVGVGDTMTLRLRRPDGLSAEGNFTVAGIGGFVLLSLFSYKGAYAEGAVLRSLLGVDPGAATEVVLTLPDGDRAKDAARAVSEALASGGIRTEITDNKALTRVDVDVGRYQSLDAKDAEDNGVKVSVWTEMGKTFRGIGEAIRGVTTALTGLLAVVFSLLVVSLVTLIGIERFHEIGTLRALGFGQGLVTRVFLAEIATAGLLGAALGFACGQVLLLTVGRIGLRVPFGTLRYVMGDRLELDPAAGPGIGIAAAVLVLCVASAWIPARRACAVSPADTIRIP